MSILQEFDLTILLNQGLNPFYHILLYGIVMKEKGSWCMVLIDDEGTKIEAKITHKGGGKFKILDDEKGGKYKDKKVDASDIFYCRIDK
jgi:hypothetical protein